MEIRWGFCLRIKNIRIKAVIDNRPKCEHCGNKVSLTQKPQIYNHLLCDDCQDEIDEYIRGWLDGLDLTYETYWDD
jgi:hypothetical protein